MIVEGGYNLPEETPVKLAGEKEEAKEKEPAKDEKPSPAGRRKARGPAEAAK